MSRLTAALGAFAMASCLGPAPGGEPSVTLQISALNLQGVGDVVWDVEVTNGAPPPEVVWQRRVTSSAYGDGAGSASLVGPCDASPGVADNHVRVWVVGVYDGPIARADAGAFAWGSATGAGVVSGTALAFENPTVPVTGPLSRLATCSANADVAVSFDVTLARPAEQGFFDVAVDFDDVYCAAKLDCCYDTDADGCDASEDIRLLFDAGGQRGRTFVLGFACTAGPGDDAATALYLSPVSLDCSAPNSGEDFAADVVLDPASGEPGNLCAADEVETCPAVISGAAMAGTVLFQIASFRGAERLTSGGVAAQKVYWNLALGVEDGISACRLRASGTVADPDDPASPVVDGVIAAGAVYPYVRWDVDLGSSCGSEALAFGVTSGPVVTAYTGTSDAATDFRYYYDPASGAGQHPNPAALALTPALATLAPGNVATFAASDGNPPYAFSLTGPGALAGATYTAPASPGSATVRVTDALGAFVDAAVTVNAALQLAPASASVEPGGTKVFSASGGVPGYTYSVVTAGGGSFSGATYTAPASAQTVTVRVTDSYGNTANATVTVESANKVIFSTSTTYGGGFAAGYPDAMTRADALCQAHWNAAHPTEPRTFRAWLSSRLASAYYRLPSPGGPWYNTLGQLVATSRADLSDGALSAKVRYTESGANGVSTAWTDTTSDGISAGTIDCEVWTQGSSSWSGRFGNTNATTGLWTHDTYQWGGCHNQRALICVQI